jgi:hypothetical protein
MVEFCQTNLIADGGYRKINYFCAAKNNFKPLLLRAMLRVKHCITN